MTSHEALTARMNALYAQSRAVGDSFAAEMDRLAREVAQRAPSVQIELDAPGHISTVRIDDDFYRESTSITACGAASSALAVAGVAAFPDVGARARRVMASLFEGRPASDSIADAARAAAHETRTIESSDVSVVMSGGGIVSVTADAEWFDSATVDEFAEAIRLRVNDVLAASGPRAKADADE